MVGMRGYSEGVWLWWVGVVTVSGCGYGEGVWLWWVGVVTVSGCGYGG